LECPLFAFGELGDWQDRVSQSRQMGRHVVMNETTLGRGAMTAIPAELIAEREANDLRGCGQALIGRLLKACLDRGIELRTGHRAVGLDVVDGRVSGVRFETADGPLVVSATGGVILATGGFEWNPDLIRSFIRGPLERPVSIATNTGDGLTMAMRVGASLGNMQEAWWVPVIDVGNDAGEAIPWMVNRERVQPRSIMVNKAGKRFANEAANYNAFGPPSIGWTRGASSTRTCRRGCCSTIRTWFAQGSPAIAVKVRCRTGSTRPRRWPSWPSRSGSTL
jgi:succinate dehydrogenase/fumarate reductase flavoprotein subunit